MYKCPNCSTKLKLVPQCGDLYSCAGCKEFFTLKYLKALEDACGCTRWYNTCVCGEEI